MNALFRVLIPIATAFSMPASAAEDTARGERLFRENCAACHQQTGLGIPNVFPALAGSEVVRGSADDVALVALIGRGDMPSFNGSLEDEELASIVNYVRNAWGNVGSTITPARVARLKASVE